MGVVFLLFFILQAMTPTILIVPGQSLVEPPGLTLDAVFLAEPDYTRGIYSVLEGRRIPVSAAKATIAQGIYALCGAWLLGLWLWQGRRLARIYSLILGLAFLGLSLLGSCLGYFVYEEREPVIRVLNTFLPALVHVWIALLLCSSTLLLVGLLESRLSRNSPSGAPT
jgi:hypothetical protein